MCAGMISTAWGPVHMVPCRMVLLILVKCTSARGDPWGGAALSSHPGQDWIPTIPHRFEGRSDSQPMGVFSRVGEVMQTGSQAIYEFNDHFKNIYFISNANCLCSPGAFLPLA